MAQEHASGCGVATTSYILGISYKKTIKLFKDGEFRAQSRGFYCREIVRALGTVGLNYNFRHINKKNKNLIYRNKIICYIRKNKKYPQGHYIARINNEWIDPWINYPSLINVSSGIRKRLPGQAVYAILPI